MFLGVYSTILCVLYYTQRKPCTEQRRTNDYLQHFWVVEIFHLRGDLAFGQKKQPWFDPGLLVYLFAFGVRKNLHCHQVLVDGYCAIIQIRVEYTVISGSKYGGLLWLDDGVIACQFQNFSIQNALATNSTHSIFRLQIVCRGRLQNRAETEI